MRPNVVINTGFNAEIDQKMEIGSMSEEVTVTSAAPVVDTKKTTTGATFDKDILEKIPTARDPWQIVNMAPGVSLSRLERRRFVVRPAGLASSRAAAAPTCSGTSKAGRSPTCRRTPRRSYFNFDSFEQIQVTTGGGDVSVQSSGLAINLVTKSGSNKFKGTLRSARSRTTRRRART